MSESLQNLEANRSAILRQMDQLGDFRPGSISAVYRRCGKASCHCGDRNDLGHGPHFQMTYKVEGRTVTESLAGRASVEKAEQEIAAFRKFETLCQEFIEINQKICRSRPIEAQADGWTVEEKKRRMQSIRRWRKK